MILAGLKLDSSYLWYMPIYKGKFLPFSKVWCKNLAFFAAKIRNFGFIKVHDNAQSNKPLQLRVMLLV